MKKVHMCYKGVTEGKIKKGKISFSIFIFIYTIHLAYLKVYTKFESTGSNMRNLRQKFSLERKKNEQMKGLICYVAVFVFFTQYNSRARK